MTADGHFEVPRPINEPVRQYPPGDSHRKSLKGRLAAPTDARTEIPMTIGAEPPPANGNGDRRPPHPQGPSLRPHPGGTGKVFHAPIPSALAPPRSRAG